jgi:hypothetical protein
MQATQQLLLVAARNAIPHMLARTNHTGELELAIDGERILATGEVRYAGLAYEPREIRASSSGPASLTFELDTVPRAAEKQHERHTLLITVDADIAVGNPRNPQITHQFHEREDG